MLLNNWYVAAESDALEDTPLSVRMLGADFVLFRGANREIACLSAVCCHRGASLAAGKVAEGRIECPYHGWRYETDGKCVLIPALGADASIPKRARVDRYPTREMFGWIWVFLGDTPEEERPPFHTEALYPEYFDTESWRCVRLTYEMPVNWQRSEENSIDGSHPTFVHRAFGTKRDPKLQLVEVKNWEWGASTTRERTPPTRDQKAGKMREITQEKRGNTRATTEFHVCGITNRTDILRSDGLHQVQLAARTPIDELNTRLFFIQARNYLRDDEFDEERMAGLLHARDEDVSIVQIVKPPLTPAASDELLVESDQLETAFRKKMRELVDKGWEIDSDTVERERKRRVYVIPCPERGTDPKNWVHKAVPTTRPRRGAAGLAAE